MAEVFVLGNSLAGNCSQISICPATGLITDDISDAMAPVNIELMAELCRECINFYDQSTEAFSTRGAKH
eukprot:8927230-Ditylum_brightwellii.AAC.1